ncbi:MAG: hypothetical protein H6544_00315 [Prevotellaceae bacterium]|nr:hypothetical protein [Prevotellaceae bacterium]
MWIPCGKTPEGWSEAVVEPVEWSKISNDNIKTIIEWKKISRAELRNEMKNGDSFPKIREAAKTELYSFMVGDV